MTDKEILDKLNELFQDVLDDDDVRLSLDTVASDVEGWDSLAHVRLMIAVERLFGVKFSATDLSKLENVGTLVRLIQLKSTQRL